ncbi:hypothetical protein FPRO04_08388 [Fusarium proliferatum]|nr:hypothetical protein FPRO03_04290 [Fusarium proliferatum]KAG4275475.1 hypothetical protein FPRO04_08388 [Fusarium proliferatum]
MVSSSFLASALAVLAIHNVNAGPCRPSSVSTTESAMSSSSETTLTLSTTAEHSVITTQTTTISDAVSSSETLADGTTTTQVVQDTTTTTAVEITFTVGSSAATTETTSISEDISTSVTLSDGTTTLLSITTTTEVLDDTTTTAPATTTTTAAAVPDECFLNAECEALYAGAKPICDAGTCVPDNSQGSPCSDNSDCTIPGQTCSDSGFFHVASQQPDSCVDINDCLLSVNPICTIGLCECPQSTNECTPRSDLQLCQSNNGCSAGATCQQGLCVDQVQCGGPSDCVANLDLCVLPGVCVCQNGVCALDG